MTNDSRGLDVVQTLEDHQQATIKVDFYRIKKVALTLRALNHKLRQQLIELIDKENKIAVTEIYVHLRLEQSVASQQLSILRKAGIVKTTRDGRFVYYSINHRHVEEINRFLEAFK